MSIEELKSATRTTRKPVIIRLADGQIITVPHMDFISFPPAVSESSVFIIYCEPPAKGFHVIDCDQVVSVQREP